MSGSPAAPAFPAADRPGRVRPMNEKARRALKALDEDRLADARKNADAIPDEQAADRAWKLHLQAVIAFRGGNLQQAVRLLEQAAATAMEYAANRPESRADLVRLAAESLHELGCAQRRRERLEEAMRAHRAARELREECGTADERWESALDLGQDCRLAGKEDEAAEWFRGAVESACQAEAEPQAKAAAAWGKLSATLQALRRWDEAAAAAQSARAAWQTHDPGCVEAFRVEARLGEVRLAQARGQLDSRPSEARGLLERAARTFTSARAELAAFGAETADDVALCDESLDFVRRLLATIG